MKKLNVTLMVGIMALAVTLSGCSSTKETTSVKETDTVSNAEATNEKEILVVSFGTSYNQSREITIGAIENAIKKAFPEYAVNRAFTSQIIIDILSEREGIQIDNVEQALDKAVAEGVKTLIVQPTHLMNGYEYTDLANTLEKYKGKFQKVALAEPLLTSDEDFEKVIQSITSETADYDDGATAICFMGHGTEAESNSVYAKLQEMLKQKGYDNYFIGTVEATPTLDDVMAEIQKGEYKKVVLEPLMIVSGDHANNDMAGEEEDSWKTQFEKAGYEVECILRGLGEFKGIQDIFVEHTQNAINSL